MSLCIENLSVTLQKKSILKEISMCANPSNIHILVGPNGAGKTTLLKSISGFLRSQKKSLTLFDKDIHTLSIQELAKSISYMPQFAEFPSLSVLEVLELGRYAISGNKLKQSDRKILDETIESFELDNLLDFSIDQLSGGQRQKVFLASALAQEPQVLLLDEPISHLDPKNQLEVLRNIKMITKSKNIITLIVLHDIQHALHYGDKILMMKDGKLLYDLDAKEVEEEHLNRVFDVRAKLFKEEKHTFVYYRHEHDG